MLYNTHDMLWFNSLAHWYLSLCEEEGAMGGSDRRLCCLQDVVNCSANTGSSSHSTSLIIVSHSKH
jgi:hypothetical protein